MRKGEEAWSVREAKAEPRTFVRVGLNRWTETAEEGILYTLEALVPGPDESAQGEAKSEESDPPLSFVGYWTMTDTQWKALQALLAGHVPYEDDASSPGHPGGNPSGNGFYSLRIGTARARGMGEVALYLPPAPVLESELERRLDDFQPQDSKGNLLDPDRLYFALTLRSPLLMYDARGRPCMTITPETLADYAAIPAGLEPLERATYLEQELWSGWSPAWGLPKPVTPVLAPGSVLAFRAPVTTKTDVLAFMKSAEEEGLGEHRAEGWGEVAPCDPLHVQFDAGGMR
jgi:CRISPR-associated protein Csx10